MSMLSKKRLKTQEPKMTITIDVFADHEFEFNMSGGDGVSIATAERACNRAVLYVQAERNKDARATQHAQMQKAARKELEDEKQQQKELANVR